MSLGMLILLSKSNKSPTITTTRTHPSRTCPQLQDCPGTAHRPNIRLHLLSPQLIGLVFVLIFAVLGREFFSERAPGSFGTFDVSLVTLFGAVSTLQQWPEELPLVFASETEEVRVSRELGTLPCP
jgi:hypothetical protein